MVTVVKLLVLRAVVSSFPPPPSDAVDCDAASLSESALNGFFFSTHRTKQGKRNSEPRDGRVSLHFLTFKCE